MQTVQRACHTAPELDEAITRHPSGGASPQDAVDLRTAARLLGVQYGTMASLREVNAVEVIRADGRSVLVTVASIERYLERPSVIARRARGHRRRAELASALPAVRRDAKGPEREARLPLRPLIDYVEASEGRRLSVTDLACRFREAGTVQIYRALAEGVVPMRADRWACASGVHPAVVWGDDFYMGCEIGS